MTIALRDEWIARLPGLSQLWAQTTGHPAVRIAVLDGPVDGATVPQAALVQNGVIEHGTHVSSIVAGSGDYIIPGMAPQCTVLSIPIFDPDAPDGGIVCSQPKLAAGMVKAIEAGANIINVSASQQADLLSVSPELTGAVQAALDRDILVVAATGNQGCACDTIPASIPGVLAVGAHGEKGAPLIASNWGPNQRAQGIIAPGRNIPGACVGGGLCRASGTSFATATVSGIAGLLMSLDADRGITPSGERIRRALINSAARPPEDQIELASAYLAGRLDVSRAMKHLLAETAFSNAREEKVTMPELSNAMTVAPDPSAAQTEIMPARQSEDAPSPPQSGNGLVLADCGCGCGGTKEQCNCAGKKTPQLVYAIGRLGVSFVSQARRDAIWRAVNGSRDGDLKPISDRALKDLIKKNPFYAQSVVWTLSRSEVAMYAIVPSGAYAAETYKWLVDEWSDADVEFVSIPGVIAGSATLYEGSHVDVVIPDLRGMYSWETKTYVKALSDARKQAVAGISEEQVNREIHRFLGKIYFSIRNRGVTPEERALNAAATNAFNFSPVIVEAGQDGLTLRDVAVERSPLNRPGSDYYDVLLTFFNPRDRQGTAPLRARFTIDVSDTVPVMIGDPVIWYEY